MFQSFRISDIWAWIHILNLGRSGNLTFIQKVLNWVSAERVVTNITWLGCIIALDENTTTHTCADVMISAWRGWFACRHEATDSTMNSNKRREAGSGHHEYLDPSRQGRFGRESSATVTAAIFNPVHGSWTLAALMAAVRKRYDAEAPCRAEAHWGTFHSQSDSESLGARGRSRDQPCPAPLWGRSAGATFISGMFALHHLDRTWARRMTGSCRGRSDGCAWSCTREFPTKKRRWKGIFFF